MRYSLIIVLTVLTLLSKMAYANNALCYEPSPNLSALGDAYYDVENASELSDEEKNKINAFFGVLAGNWKGNARTIECRGPNSAPHILSHDAVLTAEARVDNSIGLSINANKHFIDNGIKRTESVSLLGSTFVFGFEFADDNHLIFSEKYRRLNKPAQQPEAKTKSTLSTVIDKITGKTASDATKKKASETKKLSRVSEIIYNIALENNVLIVSRTYYTNGVLTGSEFWQLVRD